MMKRIQWSVLLVTSLLLVSGPARADDIADAALALCEKVKACAMSEIAEKDLTPEIRQMMQPMLDNMCTSMKARVGEVPIGDALYDPAVDCVRSMQTLSCQAMQSEQVNTAACQAYEKMAGETYGQR
ncbi:MAG: hypothetical protein V7459_11285 [Oceanicoccus sp.]